MDSLGQVAVHARLPEERFNAILRIEAPGIVWTLRGDTTKETIYPGIVARMRRIYPDADPAVRQRIVSSLFLQAEQGEAIAFLGDLSQTDDLGPEFTIAETAVRSLSMMGTEGEAELRRVHATG
ncbi:MAG: hypothetical protein KJZ47_00190, partial [Gemmatimonadales bacterium]|nr:hypothetical protein [Gemmatimonadales bacterium]